MKGLHASCVLLWGGELGSYVVYCCVKICQIAIVLHVHVYALATFPGPIPSEPQAPAPADSATERPRLPTPKDVDSSFFASKPQLIRPPIKTLGGPPPRPPSNTKPALPEPQESTVSYTMQQRGINTL